MSTKNINLTLLVICALLFLSLQVKSCQKQACEPDIFYCD